jgi:hypothetical protein
MESALAGDAGDAAAVTVFDARGRSLPEDAGGTPHVIPVGGAQDGSVASDATLDTSAPGFCRISAANRLFCDDFDLGSNDLAMRWTAYSAAAGPGQLDLAEFRSPSRSLQFAINKNAGAATSELYKSVGAVAGAVEIEFDLKVAEGGFSADGVVSVAKFEMYPPPAGLTFHQLSIGVHTGGAYFDYYRTDPGSSETRNIPSFGAGWRHIRVKISFPAGVGSATLWVDNAPVSTIPLLGVTVESFALGLGSHYARNLAAPWRFNYDNVEVRKP